MKRDLIPVALKSFLVFLACATILGFSTGKPSNPHPEAVLTEAQFHNNIAGIINGKGISQKALAQTMQEAARRKSGSETASRYIENYMNTHFKADPSAAMASTNRVSIAAPGQSDLNMSAECNQTALKELISNTVGYYYAYAVRCDGTYKYDAEYYSGGSTVYVRAEASTYILEAFILF